MMDRTLVSDRWISITSDLIALGGADKLRLFVIRLLLSDGLQSCNLCTLDIMYKIFLGHIFSCIP
jgi:hypothetical protein